ncbi:hypothetical protein BLS_007849 [Venturia inaequalis]|uniref:Uncharacterized protein n=1 Tax=Venturia inaequalis TaxID=5025 RepID=A0A8H3YMF9_VENIN|nr:hypothetical protein BLS_007849 [Venturia inaequalis]
MSHLTKSANTKTDVGAPGPTGTSPGQDIGTDEVQEQSHNKQQPKHSHDHVDKLKKPASSESQSTQRIEEEKLNNQNEDSLDVVTEPPVRASTPTPSGAPGATGASPNQPFGGDELRDERPENGIQHKHNDHSKEQDTHSSEKDVSSLSGSSTDSNTSSAYKSESKPSVTAGSETDPGVRASTKTPAGAVGPTGTAPMETIGDDESRDDSHKTPVYHERNSHVSGETSSSQKASEDASSISKEKEAASSDSTEDSSKQIESSGFDGPNASFSSEIGSKEDPGRVAEEKMIEQNAQRGDVGSMGVKQDTITGGGQFDLLESEEAA